MSQSALHLQASAQEEAANVPALLARADHLAGNVLLGEHGRRRSGIGDDFWQYRPAQVGDERRSIDWRQSAKSDGEFVREREWQIAQSVQIWVDCGQSMRFSSSTNIARKIDRARLLALATAILLDRGGERVGITGGILPPRRGRAQILRIAEHLVEDDTGLEEYAPPDAKQLIPNARAVFASDFMGPMEPITSALTKAADRGVRGALIQCLDPSEESFPFQGRMIFESVGATFAHDTLQAADLKARYLDRLAERKAALASLAAATGWQHSVHLTSAAPQAALLWLHHALGGMG